MDAYGVCGPMNSFNLKNARCSGGIASRTRTARGFGPRRVAVQPPDGTGLVAQLPNSSDGGELP